MKYQLICMSFDGEYQKEKFEFDTIEEVWDYSNVLGSKWFFYPFHFVIKGQTIADAPEIFDWMKNKRIKTIKKYFNKESKREDLQGVDAETFAYSI